MSLLEIECVDNGNIHIDQFDRPWVFFDWPVANGCIPIFCHACGIQAEQGWWTEYELDDENSLLCEHCIAPLFVEHTKMCDENAYPIAEEE